MSVALSPLPSSRRPVTGGWFPGDPVGDRRFIELGPLRLESGALLPNVTVAYETWGALAPDRSNAVLVQHALTGDSHAAGAAGPGHPTPGWWDALIGPGKALDTDSWFVIAPNVLGGCQGTTGPSSPAPDGRPWASRFPSVTVRDQVAVERRLLHALGLERLALMIGGSMGGMRTLEYAVSYPDEVERVAVIASIARTTADQLGWNLAQAAAIVADAEFHGGDYYDVSPTGPRSGLGTARTIAHLTYRTARELEQRFGNRLQHATAPGDRPYRAVESYLGHHADKLVDRFDANSYLTLLEAMNTHDVGRDRGGVAVALARVRARALVVGVDSDRLFLEDDVRAVAEGIGDARYRVVSSIVGHDGFLAESAKVSDWVGDLLVS